MLALLSVILYCCVDVTTSLRQNGLKELPVITESQHGMNVHEKGSCLEHVKYACILIDGFSNTADPQINGVYCVYQCDEEDTRYPEYIHQDTCSYYIQWGSTGNYIIYSYENERNSSVNQHFHIFASSEQCDTTKVALANMQSCSFWESYDVNNIGQPEHKITVHPYEGTDGPTMNLCNDEPVFMGLNTGEIAAIVICIVLVTLLLFGGAINYWD